LALFSDIVDDNGDALRLFVALQARQVEAQVHEPLGRYLETGFEADDRLIIVPHPVKMGQQQRSQRRPQIRNIPSGQVRNIAIAQDTQCSHIAESDPSPQVGRQYATDDGVKNAVEQVLELRGLDQGPAQLLLPALQSTGHLIEGTGQLVQLTLP
jgi:hypothetical protein